MFNLQRKIIIDDEINIQTITASLEEWFPNLCVNQ